MLLGKMYLEDSNIEKAKVHTLRAININPDHDAPVELLKKITILDVD